jgi:hypothetical protein
MKPSRAFYALAFMLAALIAFLVAMQPPKCTCVLDGNYAATDDPSDCPKHGPITE